MSGNITWAKSIGNWGVNSDDTAVVSETVKVKKDTPSKEEIELSISDLLVKCDELMVLSSTMYETASHKEIYDVLIHLSEVKKSLKSITV